MFVLALILFNCLLIYSNHLWIVYFVCLILSFLYFVLEVMSLCLIGKNVKRCYETFQNSIQQYIVHPLFQLQKNQKKTNEKMIQSNPESLKKFSVKNFSKFWGYLNDGYQILLIKLHYKSEVHISMGIDQQSKNLNQTKSILQPQTSLQALIQTENTDKKRQKYQKQIQQLYQKAQKQKQIKLSYINKLIFKQFRQFLQNGFYATFFLLLLGYKIVTFSSFIHIIKNQLYFISAIETLNLRLTKEYIIFLTPLMINSLWKFQRICNEVTKIKNTRGQTKGTRQQTSHTIHFELINKIIQPENKSPLLISKNKELTIKQVAKPNPQQSFQIIVTLMYFQCTVQALLSLYAIIQFFVCVCLKIYLAFFFLLKVFLEEEGYHIDKYDIWEEVKFVINRFTLLVLFLTYIAIKYQQSFEKTIGMKQAFWGIHMTIDKVTKFFGTEIRKFYHRKLYKIGKKLNKIGIKPIKPAKKNQKIQNLISNDDLLLQYYSSV